MAKESGFRPTAVEKVLRLCGILQRLDFHPTTKGTWLLKGGTALNLLHLDVPRMSVDIDLNYVGAVDPEGMIANRLLNWSASEREFLDRLHDEGKVDGALLHQDPMIQARIMTQPTSLFGCSAVA